jgi:hypothetical protein
VITERIIDLIMLALSMLLLAGLEFALFRDFMRDKIVAPLVASPGGLRAGPALIMAVVLGLGGLLLYRYRKAALFQKTGQWLRGVSAGLLSVLRMRRSGVFIVHTLLMWLLYYLATYVCFYALDATAHLNARQGLFILVAGGLGMSAPVQGGIGAYHYIVSQALLLFGVALTDGIVYATLVHTAQLALIVVTGLASLILLARGRRAAGASTQTAKPHA